MDIGARLIQPPEYLYDEKYDEKGDIWQLGLLLFELVTLRPLFAAKTDLYLGKELEHKNIQ